MQHGNSPSSFAPRSRFYQGPFGRIFPDLEPFEPPGSNEAARHQQLEELAEEMVEDPKRTPTEIANDPEVVAELEAKFNSSIPAGFTYFGQFVDHDITFDPTSQLMRANDPSRLRNFRTPRLDLDSLYGRGPADQPYLYDDDSEKGAERFLTDLVDETSLADLPRNSRGRALIGDMRNDENAMISQLHLAFLLAHNTLVDRAVEAEVERPFAEAQRTLRWLYQWIVWKDFLPRVVMRSSLDDALSERTTDSGVTRWELGLKDVYSWKYQPFMPVEFSGAAYRFGHSMVRNGYETNHVHRPAGTTVPIFDNSGTEAEPDDLRGFRAMTAANVPQWNLFLAMKTADNVNPQMARKIDTKLSNALAALPEEAPGERGNVLAFLNLARGWALRLPSGSAVADKLGVPRVELTGDHELDALWFVILKEAETHCGDSGGLGPIGSTILAATFAGLLVGDPHSYININPGWTPDDEELLVPGTDDADGSGWSLASIIRLAGLPVSAADF